MEWNEGTLARVRGRDERQTERREIVFDMSACIQSKAGLESLDVT